MKKLFEGWRKLLEGDVIDFPQNPKLSDENVVLINDAEDKIFKIIDSIYKQNHTDIPVEIIELVGDVLDKMDDTLKK